MENEIKTTHLREETLKYNKFDCMICLKKHPINKISVIYRYFSVLPLIIDFYTVMSALIH